MRPSVTTMSPSNGGTAIAPISQASNTASSRLSSIWRSTAISTGGYSRLLVSQSKNLDMVPPSRFTASGVVDDGFLINVQAYGDGAERERSVLHRE